MPALTRPLCPHRPPAAQAKGCRPCKLFARKYKTAAALYRDALFLEIFGDESKDTRVRTLSLFFFFPRCLLESFAKKKLNKLLRCNSRFASSQCARRSHWWWKGRPGSSRRRGHRSCLCPASTSLVFSCSCSLQKLMIEMGIKVTPTFVIYRGGERVHSHGGVNEGNLHKAVQVCVAANELLSVRAAWGPDLEGHVYTAAGW